MIVSWLAFGCEGPRLPTGGTSGFTLATDPCEVPGNVCRWLGVPGTALLSGEGTDRSERFATDGDPGGTFLFLPIDLTLAADGAAYYPDYNNQRVRMVGTDDLVTTVAGTGMTGDGPNVTGSAADCWDGCPALEYLWSHPSRMAVSVTDPSILWVAVEGNGRVNVIDVPAATVFWYAEGLLRPTSVAVAEDGTVYVSEMGSADIPGSAHVRRISPDGLVEIIASEPDITMPRGLTLDGDLLWIADGEGAVRWIDVADCASDAAACVVLDVGDGGELGEPTDVAIAPDGGVYVADALNDCVRIIRHDGTIDPFAGQCGSAGYAGDGGPAIDALLQDPFGVAVDADGNVYVADTGNQIIRRIVPLP